MKLSGESINIFFHEAINGAASFNLNVLFNLLSWNKQAGQGVR